MIDLTGLTVAEASQRLARGEITSADLTEAYLARVASVDPTLNCYVLTRVDEARAEARDADARRARGGYRGALDGIPIALKDNIDVAGVPTTNGMGAQGSKTAARDAEVTRRLRAAGAVILGKLNMHEGALGGTTDNVHHGRTQNPWRRGFTPGGSSGGTGAAVAARLCAAGIGTDTLGSVRLPAAYCGVAGLKPTHRVVSARGVVPLSQRLDTVGPIARSAADLGLMFDVMAGFDPEYSGSVQRPGEVTHRATQKADLDGVTCGIITNLDLVEMDADVRSAFAQSIEMFEALGASIRRIDFPNYDPTTARRAGLLVCEADGAAVHERAMTEWPGAFSPEFRSMLEYGRDIARDRLTGAEHVIKLAGFEVRRALGEVDLIVSPTTPQPAFPFDGPVPVNQADLTAIASFGGCPAVSIPCGLTRTGLPIGLQLIGRPLGERRVLAAARAFEARCGFSATPSMSG